MTPAGTSNELDVQNEWEENTHTHTLISPQVLVLDSLTRFFFVGVEINLNYSLDSGKVLLKIVANRLSDFCEAQQILPEKQCGFRPTRSTINMLFVVRRLQELGRQRKIPLYVCFVDLQKAYDSVDRQLLRKVLARAGVPSVMIDVIR